MADHITDEAVTHDPCCSSHNVPMTCERYRSTHFVQVRPCCSVDADRLDAEIGLSDEAWIDVVAAVGWDESNKLWPVLRTALAAALPVLNTTTGDEAAQDQRIEIARALGLADDVVFDLDYLLATITELREDYGQNRQRLFELGPIIDTLTHGGVADELVALRAVPSAVAAVHEHTWLDEYSRQVGIDSGNAKYARCNTCGNLPYGLWCPTMQAVRAASLRGKP